MIFDVKFKGGDGGGGVKRKSEALTCDTCKIEVNSINMWNSHLKGQKHAKKIRQLSVCLKNYLKYFLTFFF